MKRFFFLLLIVGMLVPFTNVQAGGISVDAGLTPPQNRFIFRSQYRYMAMNNAMRTTNTQMTPVVLAYGITPAFSMMARTRYIHRSYDHTNGINQGMDDPFLLSKFRLYRKNTANYVIGIAPHLASNIPVGSKSISNRTWNPEVGLNVSFRPRFLAVDVTTSYTFSDVTQKQDIRPGNVLTFNTALSAFIPMKNNSSNAISPVVEMSLIHKGKSENNAMPANETLFISPGVSFIHRSLSLEALVQLPAHQSDHESIMNQKARLILGVKYMF